MSRSNVIYKEAYNRSLDFVTEVGSGQDLPSEAKLASHLGISRTTVRAVLDHMQDAGVVSWNGRQKAILRLPNNADYFPAEETRTSAEKIESAFMEYVLGGDLAPGTIIRESEMAREFDASPSAVREFLIGFSRFGLLEKEPNRHWVLRGFTRSFALELFEVRETWETIAFDRFLDAGPDPSLLATLLAMKSELLDMQRDIDARYLDFARHDEAFHRAVVGFLDNRFVEDFFQVVAIIFHYHYRWNKADERDRNWNAMSDHLAVLELLEAGEYAKARTAFRRHLDEAKRTLLHSVKWAEYE